ncbi:MAG: hypothetical protein RIQ56_862 [Candidatus Parcubacteria bacterium]|jgi:hypothetical protein
MDIENLNKSQIIMLTLLVSFMTSIATGIVTVSLMEQAPPTITQTVSKVIEHTVEKVVPDQAAAAAVAVPQTIEKTVYVKESDTTAKAVETVSPSIIRLMSSDELNPVFLSLGVVVDDKGVIVADSFGLGEEASAIMNMPGGKSLRLFVIARDETTGLAYLAPSATSTVDWKPAAFATQHPTLGTSIIALAGKSVTRINPGVVTALSSLPSEKKDEMHVIETNISTGDILPGSPIIDTAGSVLGVSTGASRASYEKGFVVASAVVIPQMPKEQKEEQ